MTKPLRAALYARVSTSGKGQDVGQGAPEAAGTS